MTHGSGATWESNSSMLKTGELFNPTAGVTVAA